MKHQSLFDPTRETAGKIYRDAQLSNTDEYVIAGDLTNELMKSLVDDINDTIIEGTKEFKGKEFYIMVYEKKDQQMDKAILRRLYKTRYRPYPEDDTVVFRVNPTSNDVRFCWCLPHYSDMPNMINNENLYDKEMIASIKAFLTHTLEHFGFCKDPMGHWMVNPNYTDKPMEKRHKILTA